MGLVDTSPVISQAAKNIAQKSNEPPSETLVYVSQRLCLLDRCDKMHVNQNTFCSGSFEHELSSQNKSQQTVQLARRFFTQKHRSAQQREDCAEGS